MMGSYSEFCGYMGFKSKSYVAKLKKEGRLVMVGDKIDFIASQERINETATAKREEKSQELLARHQEAIVEKERRIKEKNRMISEKLIVKEREIAERGVQKQIISDKKAAEIEVKRLAQEIVEKSRHRYSVQGSAAKPYRITFDGCGAELKAFCTCSAGSRGRVFCKHIAALIKGDFSKVVEPSDDTKLIAEISVGSPLILTAAEHIPFEQKYQKIADGINTIQDIAVLAEPLLADKYDSLIMQYSAGDWGSEHLGIYKKLKNGDIRQNPFIRLSYEPVIIDYNWDGDLQMATSTGNPRKAERPWLLDSIRFGKIDSVATAFIEKIKKYLGK